MNITGMPVQPLLQAQTLTRTKIPAELSNVFQGILQKSKLPNAMVSNTSNQLKFQNPKELVKELLDSLSKEVKEQPDSLPKKIKELLNSLPKEVEEQLVQLLKETDDVDKAFEELDPSIDILQQLKEMLGKTSNNNAENLVRLAMTGVTPNLNTTVVSINKKEIQHRLLEISNKAELLLAGITDQKGIAKIAPEIQKLLEQWSGLRKKLVGSTDGTILPGNLDTVKNTKTESIWRELVSAYHKRDQLVTSQQYSTNAKVTSADVEKWIGKALSKQGVPDNVSPNQIVPSSMPISKVEQYVIHLSQTQNTQNSGQQLVDKFQEVLTTSKFLAMNNGRTQLSIALRPANLGEMMVKLTQINGEMTVRIIVASAAAKDMLESNMHQLKHMFSPQQVVIEKQDISAQQTQNAKQENEQQSMDHHNQNQSEHSNPDQQKQSTDDFEKQFHEILMNEKV